MVPVQIRDPAEPPPLWTNAAEFARRRVLDGDGTWTTELLHACPECGRKRHAAPRESEPAPQASAVVLGLPDSASHTPVSAVMRREFVCAREDVSVESLAAALLDRGLSAAPVIDGRGRPVGYVSTSDLLRAFCEAGDAAEWQVEGPLSRGDASGDRLELGAGFHAEPPARGTAAEVMTPFAFAVDENASLARAAALMAFERVHQVPVVSRSGRVVGVATAVDVLRWLAQQHGYLVPDRT